MTGLAAAVAVALVATVQWATRRAPEASVTTAPVSRGPIARRIFATGAIQATRTVDVGAQVSGAVQTLNADFNSIVRAHEVVARIDPSLYEAALAQAQASMAQAEAAAAQARADLAGLRTAEEDARTRFVRARALGESHLITQADLDAAQIALNEAVAGTRSGEANVSDADAVVAEAKAAVAQARTNLDHTYIYSPIDGIVLNRAVDVGQTVAAAVQAPVLFTLATNLARLQVQLNIDQSEIGGVEPGQTVTFEVESYPDETFHGRITQVRLQPIAEQSTTATTIATSTMGATTTSMATVISYATMIDVDNADGRLRPGMTASVALIGARREGALRVPNGALSFRPTAELFRALGQTEPATPEGVQAGGDANSKPHELWTFDGQRLTPVAVKLGLSDDQWTEVVSGPLSAGAAIVTQAAVRTPSRF